VSILDLIDTAIDDHELSADATRHRPNTTPAPMYTAWDPGQFCCHTAQTIHRRILTRNRRRRMHTTHPAHWRRP